MYFVLILTLGSLTMDSATEISSNTLHFTSALPFILPNPFKKAIYTLLEATTSAALVLRFSVCIQEAHVIEHPANLTIDSVLSTLAVKVHVFLKSKRFQLIQLTV